jgi:hypothetical protein
MIRPWVSCVLLGILALALPVLAQAGALDDNLSAYTDQTAEGYLKPLQESFGQALHANLFTAASLPALGFHARLDIKVMSVFFDDGDRTFPAGTGGDFTPYQTIEAPTVVGSGESVVVDGDGGTQYVFPGGFDLTSLTVPVPQITVSALASEFMLRWVGFQVGGNDIGNISLLGLGFRHSISSHWKGLPVDVAGAVYWHKFDVESNLLDVETFSIGAQASRNFAPLTLYGGLAYETVQMSAEYTTDSGPQEEVVQLTMKTEKTLHLVAGAGLDLGPMRLNLSGDLAQRLGLSAGLSLGF